ncbi:hypothetical protein C8R43DRAFT_1091525 [Mycena crocata]|nr:hypothetical protein C8R43DRAFT_1091525 [Mycena crocata]
MAPSSVMKDCPHCGETKNARGIGRHISACALKKAENENTALFAAQLQVEQRGEPANNDFDGWANPAPAADIKRVFHPHSKRDVTFQSFSDYVSENIAERVVPTDKKPWEPFRSQLDFEVAEFCENNMLNKGAIETLISLIRRCMFNPDAFTLNGHREVDELWELASHKCTAFERGAITIQYKKEDRTFDTYTRPLWNWARHLVEDPRLVSTLVWDAEKVHKFNGDTYVRFYHEPWTADGFWAAQSTLPDDPAAKPVCYFLYADKSKLSSFGTQKGYPVIARLANIPVEIRNSVKFGGRQVVGHQPIVNDDPQERKKPAFSTFKTVVWHTAFSELMESLVHPSKVGDWIKCGDGILRWLWPRILILAADYEEACVMALIRGLQGLYPCPICFVPWNEQSDLSTEHPLRTAKESEEILTTARAKNTAAEREEILKDHGLRDAENCFWKIKDSDPHAAISYDPLHADDSGLWGDHLFGQIKDRVNDLGRAAIVKIESQIAAFPPWRGLNHFESVMNITFNDATKREDVGKIMLFVAHNVLVDDAGLLLLQMLRSYLEHRTALSFHVHTSETIANGKQELLTFDNLLKEYVAACEGTDYAEKNWNVPKVHSRYHAYDDVQKKGASRNFGTKTSESMHRPIRDTYHRMTNFKDVTPQLVKHDHRRAVATLIREQMDALTEYLNDFSEEPEDLETSILSNIDIGSKVKPVTFLALEQEQNSDRGFERFRIRFGEFLSDFLPAHGYKLPNGKRIRFEGTHKIEPFQFVKVHYESMSTWSSTQDYLRCNPKFHGQPRYDCVIVETADKPIFAQLLYLFSCTVENKSHPFALILPMDVPIGQRRRKDKLLRFRRVKAQARKNTEFISLHSVIRGAVLVPDCEKSGEFIVFDVLDGDMSLRLKKLYPEE